MEAGPELLLFAAPEMGHLLAEVELGRRLIDLNPQISIAILIPKLPFPNPKIDAFLQSLSADLHLDSNRQRISIVDLPQLDPIPPESSFPVVDRLSSLYKPVVKRVVEERSLRRRLAGIVFDMFCTPMVDVAEELGVPSYIFYTSGANMLSLTLMLESLAVSDLPKLFEGLSPESTPVNFPGFRNPVPFKVFPEVFVNKELQLYGPFLRFASQYRKAKGILVNTFSELESDLLQSLFQDEHIPPIYSVGPILHLSRNRNSNGDLTVLSWLDEQPARSVVFLCFGSKVGSFEKAEVEEIAIGIERRDHRFLWSIREPSDEGILPEGFLDRTAGVGKVIGWAPQTEVLGHVAVGAFVSHCGWNSTIEGLWFGVPVVAWPMYAEQQLNAFSLVKELGLAVEMKMDYRFDMRKRKGSVVVEAEEVEMAIRRVMEGEEGEVVRKKVEEMSVVARKAMEEGGSSYVSLSRFIHDVIKSIDA